MPRKLDLINALYEEGVRELSQNYENWLRFLRSACWNYKCPFSEQLLIQVEGGVWTAQKRLWFSPFSDQRESQYPD